MYTFLSKEVMFNDACRVCLAGQIFNTIKDMNGEYIRGKRVVCLSVINSEKHTCHKHKEE